MRSDEYTNLVSLKMEFIEFLEAFAYLADKACLVLFSRNVK